MENKKKFKISKKVIIPLAIVCLIIIAVILTYIFKKNNNIITTSMQFDYLGYDNFYENNEDTVTVKEANKILLSAYLRTNDMSAIMDNDSDLDSWTRYGYDAKYLSKTEGDNKLTYIRLYELLYDTRIQIGEETRCTSNELNLNSEVYQQNQIEALNMLYNNGFITTENIDSNSIHNYVTKEYFEDIIVKYLFKYSLIGEKENKIDYEKTLNIPQSKKYFYLEENSIEKELEYNTLKIDVVEGYLLPKETYSQIRYDIDKIKSVINEYFNIILNIDYENINEEQIIHKMENISILNPDDIKYYIEYVKENKIKITGNSTVITPIIYYVNGTYYVRTKIQFKIESTDTRKNILLGDMLGKTTKYNNKEIKYIDLPITKNHYDWVISCKNINDYIIK